jgi:hypothetical protein
MWIMGMILWNTMASKQDGVQGFEATEWEKKLQILGFLEWTTMGYIYIYIRFLTRYVVVVMTSIDTHQQTSLDQVILSMGLLLSAPSLDRLVVFHTPKLCGLPCESSDSW